MNLETRSHQVVKKDGLQNQPFEIMTGGRISARASLQHWPDPANFLSGPRPDADMVFLWHCFLVASNAARFNLSITK